MRGFISLLLVLFFTIPISLNAQTLTNRERRHINTRVLELIEQYEGTAVIHDEEAEYVFCSLFKSDQVSVV